MTRQGKGGYVRSRRTRQTGDVSIDDDLRALAADQGVATDYWDWQGRHVDVPDATVRAVLTALGLDVSGHEAIQRSRREQWLGPWRRMLPACLVIREGWAPRVKVHVTHGDPVALTVRLEDGGARSDVWQEDVWVEPQQVDDRLVGEATFRLPPDLPLGWHKLVAATLTDQASCVLVVTPSWLGLPQALDEHPTWGIATQLYALRSRRSWGVGDLGDLRDLATWSATELGAGFVLVNPLHAASVVPPMEPSPYLPATRRFANPLYLRVEDVPEYAQLSASERAAIELLAIEARGSDPRALLDRDATWAAKLAALEILTQVPLSTDRRAAYETFALQAGPGLRDFAAWCALSERHGQSWWDWPEELRDAGSEAVVHEGSALAPRVHFHQHLQWLVDEQLAHAQEAARSAGMPIGIVHDLAVGVHPEGSDSWALRDAIALGFGVGAPADAFNQRGQDWNQPPWRPDRLAELSYAPYRDMLRTVLRHAGGIRVDHILGLFRLWWVPKGVPASEGTYVRYDHEAMVGILALEAHRAGAFVVGEDLGTVEPWVRDYLGERGILGTSILWFEKDGEGRPLPPERWRRLCLASVTTHDLPPTAGYLVGEHLRVREELKLLTRPIEEERAEGEADQQAWRSLMQQRGLLDDGAGEQETVEALHRLMAQAPSMLLSVALPDLVGDRRTINQPGTDEEYPNWRVPLAGPHGEPLMLEDVMASQRGRSLARTLPQVPNALR